jgi:hypothetical protein
MTIFYSPIVDMLFLRSEVIRYDYGRQYFYYKYENDMVYIDSDDGKELIKRLKMKKVGVL